MMFFYWRFVVWVGGKGFVGLNTLGMFDARGYLSLF